jgi:YHS domain-containing protein
MKKIWIISPLALILGGCSSPPAAAPPPEAPPVAEATAPPQLTATQELAKFCRVCVVDKGEKMEEFLPSRLNVQYKGQTYKFCSEPCRKEFNAAPTKYALKTAAKP